MKIIEANEFSNLGGEVVFWQSVNGYELDNGIIKRNNSKEEERYYPLDNENIFDDFINLSTSTKNKGYKRKSKEKEVFGFVKEYGFLGFRNFYGKKKYSEILDIKEGKINYEKINHILNESRRLKLLVEFYDKINEAKMYVMETLEDQEKEVPANIDFYPEPLYKEIIEIKEELEAIPNLEGMIYQTYLLEEGTKREWYPFKYFATIINKVFEYYLSDLKFKTDFGRFDINKPLSESFKPVITLNSLLQALYVKFYLIMSESGTVEFCDVCGGPFIKNHGSKIGHQKCIKRRSDYKAMGKWNK